MRDNTHDGGGGASKGTAGWNWIVAYLIVGLILYSIIYYLFVTNKWSTEESIQNDKVSFAVSVPAGARKEDVFTIRNDSKKGQYLADYAGKTFYTFDKGCYLV